jgi:hypothetical protein
MLSREGPTLGLPVGNPRCGRAAGWFARESWRALPLSECYNPLHSDRGGGRRVKALPGIGEAYSTKIVRVAPTSARASWCEEGDSTYDKIKEQLIAKQK